MSKNLIIDGQVLNGVTELKAKDADTGNLVSFLDTSDANATASDIQSGKSAYVNGIKVNGTNTGVSANDLDGLVDGTLIAFVMPSSKTTISQYRFYQFANMTSANLGGATSIGQYAFDGCTKLTGVILPNTLNNIGAYAFRSLCSTSGSTFVFSPASPCSVATYAFNASKLAKLSGRFTSIGSYAFSSCTSLTDIDIETASISDYAFNGDTAVTSFVAKINGSVGSYAFYNLYNVNACNLNPESVITSLGNYAFSRLGSNRANAESNVITLDLRKSTFTSIPQYGFGSDSSSTMYRNKYMKVLLPSTVSTINAYAFRYTDNCDFYFYKDTPPTLSATTAWSNATNYNIFVPYYVVNDYRTATNWTAQSSYIKGFATANTFEEGAVLPELSSEGYGLTWYSDPDCTIPVTEVNDATAEYYCLVGTEKLAYGIKSISAVECNVIISDGVKTYSAGEGVLTGTILTITAIPNIEGYVPYIFKVNGIDFVSGDTITVNSDISVTAIYYDGQTIPINPVFAENTWGTIRQVFRAGTALEFWKPGDTKPVTLTDGKTYTIRIADMQTGRYALANGNGRSNAVLEFVECINMENRTTFPINATTKENGYYTGGGWAVCDLLNIRLPLFYDLLPEDLKAAISDVTLNEYSITSPSPRSSNNKLFTPAETEIFDARHYSAEGTSNYPKFNQYEYYATNNSNAKRIKYQHNTTTALWWWLRSPCSGNSGIFCVVDSGGVYNSYNANYSYGVAPCFAI